MSNITTTQSTVKSLLTSDDVQKKFKEVLGKRTPAFLTTVIQLASQSEMLSKCEPQSIMQSAMVAATLDLSINPSLGQAYILPYGTKAQFQVGYKGFIQLAQRSGQFVNISSTPIFEGQIISNNPLTGYIFDFTKTSDKVVGYAAYFKLLNGFEKTLYMTVEELTAHGKKYSQTFKKGFGLWKDDFDSMALKTVLKQLLTKYAPFSIEMQNAVISDQAVIEDAESLDVTYTDNEQLTKKQVADAISEAEKLKRLAAAILKAKTVAELEILKPYIDAENTFLCDAYNAKENQLNAADNV